jgi:phage I-like protein
VKPKSPEKESSKTLVKKAPKEKAKPKPKAVTAKKTKKPVQKKKKRQNGSDSESDQASEDEDLSDFAPSEQSSESADSGIVSDDLSSVS